jgi:hypothetical protein
MWVILIGGFVLCYGGVSSNGAYCNGGDVNVNSYEDLLSLARKIANERGYDVNEHDFLIGRDGDFTTVTLVPKTPPDKEKEGWVLIGGGGKLFFKVENGKYKFIKIQFGQ